MRLVIAVLISRMYKGVSGETIFLNGKGYFCPSNQNERTGQSGPPSKLKVVQNIPVGPNRNDPFHLIY